MKVELLAYLTAAQLAAVVLATHSWIPAVGLVGLLLIPGRRQGKQPKGTETSKPS